MKKKRELVNYITLPTNFTGFEVKWMPRSSKIVTVGRYANKNGVIACFELEDEKLRTVMETEKNFSFKCCTFGASFLEERNLATGDFNGRLTVWDLTNSEVPIYVSSKHKGVINAIDGIGGIGGKTKEQQQGAPELVTVGQDKKILVWDVRQKEKPVLSFEGESDCWSVSFGNSKGVERSISCGFCDGTISIFDLRTANLFLSFSLPSSKGIVSLEWKDKEEPMKTLSCGTVTGTVEVISGLEKGEVIKKTNKEEHGITIWNVKHCPQDTNYLVSSSGAGTLHLYSLKGNEDEKEEKRATPSPLLLTNSKLGFSIPSFDWSPDKKGLLAFSDFKNELHLSFITNL